jgi:hypothetical protein
VFAKPLRDEPDVNDDTPLVLLPHIHARRLKEATRELLEQHLEFLEELTLRELALPRPIVNTDHVPVFFHVMSNPDARPVFDTDDIAALGGEDDVTFDTSGDYEYFCRHHPEMTGVVHVVPGGPTPVTVTIGDSVNPSTRAAPRRPTRKAARTRGRQQSPSSIVELVSMAGCARTEVS